MDPLVDPTHAKRPGAPPFWKTVLESRVPLEYASWRLMAPVLHRLPKGDGHPVLVLPGFTASDRSTVRLRIMLRNLGYRTYGWRLGANLGPTPRIVEGLTARVNKIADDNEQQISLVGWSLGGIYSRLLARQQPELFRQAITLGSPFRMRPGDRSAVSALWDSLESTHDLSFLEPMMDIARPPLQIPTTSVYTRTDGVVQWRFCLNARTPLAENIEVFGSHSGLGFNPAVGYAVADRLAQRPSEWRRFRAPVAALGAYPRAAYRPITAEAGVPSS